MRVDSGIFAGLEVFVELEDGTRLNEYPGPVDTRYSQIGQQDVSTTVCCYLECPADRSKSFKIGFEGTVPYATSHYAAYSYIDGQLLGGVGCRPHALPTAVSHVYQVTDGVGYEYPIKFKRLETTEDDAAALSAELSRSAGRIEVVFRRGSFTGLAVAQRRASTALEQKPIHEKAKKAVLDNSIQLGENKRAAASIQDIQPFALTTPQLLDLVVIFLYRGRELLMAQDIIDCPAPDPVDNNVDRASSGPDGAATLRAVKQEAQELRERLRELEGGNAAGGSSSAGTRRKRTEASSSADKRPRKSGAKEIIDARQAEVIDLTSD